MKSWIKLDNAAIIFPSTSRKYRTNLFRISFSLVEEIDPKLLQQALDLTILRFRTFKLKLKSGIFWNYFEENKKSPIVVKENPYILESFNKTDSRGYLFRVTYFQNKIGIEMFHAITDGFGATQFIKALVYEYLVLKGEKIDSEGKILFDQESNFEESLDPFNMIYEGTLKNNYKETDACHIKGTTYSDYYTGVITASCDKNRFKEVITEYNCSYTQFICAAIYYVVSHHQRMVKHKEKPFQIFVPIDLRKKFPTTSLRNFSQVVKTSIILDEKKSLEDYVKICKEQLIENSKDENFLPRVLGNVTLQRNWFMRIVPLCIKNIAFKIAYHKQSTKPNSFCISNLGDLNIPNEMQKYIKKITFANGTSKTAPINLGITYYNNRIYITFSSAIMERDIQKDFVRLLTSLGIDVIVENNDLEE